MLKVLSFVCTESNQHDQKCAHDYKSFNSLQSKALCYKLSLCWRMATLLSSTNSCKCRKYKLWGGHIVPRTPTRLSAQTITPKIALIGFVSFILWATGEHYALGVPSVYAKQVHHSVFTRQWSCRIPKSPIQTPYVRSLMRSSVTTFTWALLECQRGLNLYHTPRPC
jgi:hypothetical protein